MEALLEWKIFNMLICCFFWSGKDMEHDLKSLKSRNWKSKKEKTGLILFL